MVDISGIDKKERRVYFDDNTSIDYKGFIDKFMIFLQGRIAGETLYPADMERFMRRTSSKNLTALMKGKKMEGYMEGVSDKMLTRGQKIAIGTVILMIFVGVFVFIILKNQGLLPG